MVRQDERMSAGARATRGKGALGQRWDFSPIGRSRLADALPSIGGRGA